MDNSVACNMNMLDRECPRGVQGDDGHSCEPGLSATSSCWRLPLVPWYMLLLLSMEPHDQVAGEVLKGFPRVVLRPAVEPEHLSAIAVTRLA